MQAAGKDHHAMRYKLAAVGVMMLALVVAIIALRRSHTLPSSDKATIDADVVHVAAAVGGRVLEIRVAENMRVHKGDLLYQIDAVPYRLAVAQAQADLKVAQAQLETKRRVLATQRSGATIAADQTRNAESNYALSKRTTERLRPLAEQGYVPRQQFDQAQVSERDHATALQQSREQAMAARAAIDTEEAAEAGVQARQAALAIAQRQLDDTTVRAPHDGLVAGLMVSAGEFVAPGQTLFTLINTEEWFAVANFRETALKHIAPGDCATVYSLIDGGQPIKGVVQGIGWGVLDPARINLPRSVPYVENSLGWVHVAQRFPVRIRLEAAPALLMRLGASATVEVRHGAACP